MHSVRELADAAATEALGAELALVAQAGTLIRLEGDLGAGKTTLARGLIRALANDPAAEIPSPTYTLVQVYDAARVPTAHADLYRLADASQLEELGLEELLKDHLLVVEWPEKLAAGLSADVLTVTLSSAGAGRRAELTGAGAWAQALGRLHAIAGFLGQTPWAAATRSFLEGDASFRRYERLLLDGQPSVLMDMPARADGPPVKHGKPYSAIAHLAENISAVAGVNGYLISLGYSAPRTLAADTGQGLAVIEDLGDQVFGRMMLAGADMGEPMSDAVRLLADIAGRVWPETADVPGAEPHRVPHYDADALAIETELLTDWYWPFRRNAPIPGAARSDFTAIWQTLIAQVLPANPVWTLRDFHSPNLLWLPHRTGLQRVGLIDTQDCVLGHPAYDLVSMLQDARVTIAPNTADELLAHYCTLRHRAGDFDAAEFRAAFAILGAQRATKILGIFARLFRRDGKPGYLRHMPRVSAYLARNLQHPALAALAAWYRQHLPDIFEP